MLIDFDQKFKSIKYLAESNPANGGDEAIYDGRWKTSKNQFDAMDPEQQAELTGFLGEVGTRMMLDYQSSEASLPNAAVVSDLLEASQLDKKEAIEKSDTSVDSSPQVNVTEEINENEMKVISLNEKLNMLNDLEERQERGESLNDKEKEDLKKLTLEIEILSKNIKTRGESKPIVEKESVVDENEIVITPEEWLDKDKRPDGYMKTSALRKEISLLNLGTEKARVNTEDVLDKGQAEVFNRLIEKAKTIGITRSEAITLSKLSIEYDKKAKALIEASNNNPENAQKTVDNSVKPENPDTSGEDQSIDHEAGKVVNTPPNDNENGGNGPNGPEGNGPNGDGPNGHEGNGPSGEGSNGPEGNGPSENPNNQAENERPLNYLNMLQGVSNEKLNENLANGETQMSNLVKELVSVAISKRPDLPPIVANILKARGDSQAELLNIEEHNLPGQKDLIEKQKKLLSIENTLINMKLGFKVIKSGVLVGGVAGLIAIGLGPISPFLVGGIAGVTGIATGVLNFKINPNLMKLRIEAQKKEIEKNKKDAEKVKLDMKFQKNQAGALNTIGNLIYGTVGTGAEEDKKQFFNGINIKAINEGLAV